MTGVADFLASAVRDGAGGRTGTLKPGGKVLAIAGLVLLVMGLEAVVLYLLLPARATTEAAATDAEKSKSRSLDESVSHANTTEVSIDTFNCTNTQVASGSVIHVRFKLYAVVSSDPEIVFDFEEAANRSSKTRVRQAVEKVIRRSSIDDLYDPDQSTLRRLIREEINKILGTSYVIEVVINDFTILEQ